MTTRHLLPHLSRLSIGTLMPLGTHAMAAPQTFTVVDAAGQPIASAAVSVIVKGSKTTAPAGIGEQYGC